MNGPPSSTPTRLLLRRILSLYGLYALFSNLAFLVGYYCLPEGLFRGTPLSVAASFVAAAHSFWPHFGLTLLFNLGVQAGVAAAANLQKLKNMPAGYLVIAILALVSGLVPGTNSFLLSDLSRYSVRDGMALGLSIGGVEMFAYVLVVASTTNLGIYQYRSLLDWRGTKSMSLREVRLSRQELLCLMVAALLLVFAAYRETTMALQG